MAHLRLSIILIGIFLVGCERSQEKPPDASANGPLIMDLSGAKQILVEYSHRCDKDGNELHRFTYPEVESISVLRKRVKYRGFFEFRRRSCVSAVVPGIL